MAENAEIFETHYQDYCRQIEACDLKKAGEILGMDMDGGEGCVPFLGREFRISGKGIKDPLGERPGYGLCVILAKYVLHCPDRIYHDPQWVAFRDFKREAAMTNVNFFTSDAENAICRQFQGRLPRLAIAGRHMGGEDHDPGAGWDFSMAFALFPRIRLLVLFNDRDEDFPAQCRVLFEKHAEFYLDPESLAMSGAALAKALTRADEGPAMKAEILKDAFLDKRLTRYDRWLAQGLISYSSRVVPVAEAFSAGQWVLPPDQALEIVKHAEAVAVQNCECRSHYRRCHHPLEVCLLFNAVAAKAVAQDKARPVSPAEAAGILKTANQSGLVHLSLYMPDHQVFALCSCCSCCCHDLQIVKMTGRRELMVRSEYLAVTREEDCTRCGDCVARCPFDARALSGEGLDFLAENCLGCGLCAGTCPENAISMTVRGA